MKPILLICLLTVGAAAQTRVIPNPFGPGSGLEYIPTPSSGPGSGTVTSVTCGSGLTGGTITTTGTCAVAEPVPSGTGVVQVTSSVPGLVSGTASNCVLVNGTSAACDAPGQAAVANVTPVTVSANTTSPQVLQQLTLTAGLLNVAGNSGGVYTYNGSGIYTAAALQTPTLTWTLNGCTVSGCGSGTVRAIAVIVTPAIVTATNNSWNIRLHIANTTTGASGTLLAHGSAIVELTAASDLGTASSDSNTTSTAAIDLTGIVYLQLTVTTSTGNAGNTITEDHSSLEPASAIGPSGTGGLNFAPAVTLSAAQVNGMSQTSSGGTPVLVIPAQGPGTLIQVSKCQLNAVYGGAAFTGGGSIFMAYGSTGASLASGTLAATFLTTFPSSQLALLSQNATVIASSSILNQGIYLTNQTQAFVGGAGASLAVNCSYYVQAGLQ